jgi:dihydrofolate synthase/folylpolyglutamate synthase
VLDYEGALRYVTSTGRFGIKLGLERTRALLEEVGAPDRGMRGVLVGGTNGKGSTCNFIGAVLRQAGLRVAAMPKPHLASYTERVLLDGNPISAADFAAAVSALVPAIERVTPSHGAPTEFEILTALALGFARDRGADLLVCEVGLGGRLDATNVTDLGVKVITGVDLDHQRYLGDTIAEIAAEKAGIIRQGDLLVCGRLAPEALAVVRARAEAMGVEMWLAGRDFEEHVGRAGWGGVDFDLRGAEVVRDVDGLHTALLGKHQAANAAVAVAALQAMSARHGLDLSDEMIREGIAAARWPGRLELFAGTPRVLVDGGHNPAAITAAVAAVTRLVTDDSRVSVVFGAMSDKDTRGMLAGLPTRWPAIFTNVAEERALPAMELLALAREQGRAGDVVEPAVEGALRLASGQVGARGLVLVLGSLYLAGEARELLLRSRG